MIHLRLAGAMALVGLIFTSRPWLHFLKKFGPEMGLVVKYISIVFSIFILKLSDTSLKIGSLHQALGAVLIAISFLMIFNYQSEWIEEAGADKVEIQTPDGAVYHRTRTELGLEPGAARLVTFVLIPFILVLFGSKFIRNGQKINLN